jgi:uncharacterized protein YbaR (Trm112 family)
LWTTEETPVSNENSGDYTFIRSISMIDTKLLEILACPACKGDVEYDAKNEKLICVECRRKYPVRDGIPVMLVEESEIES